MAKSTKIAKRETSEVATTMPKHMREYQGAGLEQISTSDLEVPRIKLLQALSPELQEHNDAKPSHFWHSVAEVDLGRSLRIVPVYVDQSFILWRPRKAGGGILARAADGIHWSPAEGEFETTLEDGKTKVKWKLAKTVAASGLAEWGSMDPSDPNSPPAATRMYNIVAVMPDQEGALSPAVITLQRSAIAVARKFLGKLKISQAPSFGCYYQMEAVKDQNNQNQEFFNYKFTMAGFVEDETEFAKYRETYDVFKKMGLRIKDIEGLQTEDPTDPTAGKKENKKF